MSGSCAFVDLKGFRFDDLFEAYQNGDPYAVLTGLRSSDGVSDIRSLYAGVGAGTMIAHATGVLDSGGADCQTLFAAKGSRTGGGTPLTVVIPLGRTYTDLPPFGGQVGGTIDSIISGGTPPYSYDWALVSGVSCIIGGYNTETVSVAYDPPPPPNPGVHASIQLTVTDSAATPAVVTSGICLLTFREYDPGGP